MTGKPLRKNDRVVSLSSGRTGTVTGFYKKTVRLPAIVLRPEVTWDGSSVASRPHVENLGRISDWPTIGDTIR